MRYLVVMAAALLMLGGCESTATTQPSPHDRALADPMNYRPGWEDSNVSGGGILDYDSKGMKRDINGVLNP